MSTQIDTLRVPSALPEDPFALVARARAMQSAYIRGLARRGVTALRSWFAVRRTMAAVEDLSPRMLADIGLDVAALRAGVVRRADTEVVGTPSDAYVAATAPKTASAIEPHLRPATVGSVANTDMRHAA